MIHFQKSKAFLDAVTLKLEDMKDKAHFRTLKH